MGLRAKGNLIESFFISNEITAFITFIYWFTTTQFNLKTCKISIGPSLSILVVGYAIVGLIQTFRTRNQEKETKLKALENRNTDEKL